VVASSRSSSYSLASRRGVSRTPSLKSMRSNRSTSDAPIQLGEKPYFPIPSRQSSALFPEADYEFQIPPSAPPTPPPRTSSNPTSPVYQRQPSAPSSPRSSSRAGKRESSYGSMDAKKMLHKKLSNSSLGNRSPRLRTAFNQEIYIPPLPSASTSASYLPRTPPAHPPETLSLHLPSTPKRTSSALYQVELKDDEPFDVPLQALHGLGYSDPGHISGPTISIEPDTPYAHCLQSCIPANKMY